MRVIWRSVGGHMTVIWGVEWGWKVAISQKWLLHMKECSKYFPSKSWKTYFSWWKPKEKSWNFGFGKNVRFSILIFVSKCSRIFEIFRFWYLFSESSISFRFFRISDFQFCFQKCQDFFKKKIAIFRFQIIFFGISRFSFFRHCA